MTTAPSGLRLTFALVITLAAGATSLRAQDERTVLARLELRCSRQVSATGERVRCGIPLAETADVRDVTALRLETDRGEPFPARLEVASRWGGRPDDAKQPIKWIHATFAAGPAMSAVELVVGESPKGTLTVSVEDDLVRVGSSVGETILANGSTSLLTRLFDVDHSPAGALVYQDERGRDVEAKPWNVTVESAHAAAATVLATTTIDGLDVELRLRFVGGIASVTLDLRVVNPGPYGHFGRPNTHVYMKRLGISLPRPAGDVSAAMDGVKTKLAVGSSLSLVQTHVTPPTATLPAERLPFEIWKGRKRLRFGKRARGVLALSDGENTFGVAVERFWENAPKALSVHDEITILDLFPVGGVGPVYRGQYGTLKKGAVDARSAASYRFEGARAKTTRFRIEITSDDAATCRDRLLDQVDRPLHAAPSPADVIASGAVGYPFVAAGAKTDAASKNFDRMLRTFVDDGATDSQPTLGSIGLPGFVERGGTYGEQVFYGWFNFGDIAWGDGYCSLHYDWPFVMLLGYLRSGDVRFFDRARDMIRHRVDIDQDHDRISDVKQRGGQFYEKGWFHGNFYHPSASHTWSQGPILWHLLTGDETALEAARMNGEFIRRTKVGGWDGNWGSRDWGWSSDNLLALWWAYGDPADLAEAERLLGNFETVELRKFGGHGYVVNEAMTPPSLKPWMHDIVLSAAARHAWLTRSKRFHPLIERMQAFMLEHALLPERAGQPRGVKRNLHPGNGYVDGVSHHLLWPMACAFAFCWLATGDEKDRELAADLFDDAVLFHQGKRGAPIAFRMTNYPGSESKILSNVGLWGLPAQTAVR